MLCFSGFELYSRWVPLIKGSKIYVSWNARNIHYLTKKPEADVVLILSPPPPTTTSHTSLSLSLSLSQPVLRLVYGYFSYHTKRTEVKQGSEVINGNRTQDL